MMFKYGLNIIGIAASLSAMGRKLAQYVVISLALTIVLATSGCDNSDPDPDEGGIIGSGIMLRGTVNTSAVVSNSVVKVKASGGEVAEFIIDSMNQFSTDYLPGTGPWVLSVKPGADLAVFGIAYSDGTRNINRFSDLSLRHWFAQRLLDVDSEFESSAPFTDLPDAAEYAESVSKVFQLIKPVLDSYSVSGEGIISVEYSVNNQGIDAFLQRNTVLIQNRLVAFLITDPTMNTVSITKSQLTLESEFLDNGTVAPTMPQGIKALGSASDKIVLVWEPSIDDVAVHEYQVIRDGVLVATTPFPGYTDSGLSSVQSYSYQIIAVDGAGNRSDVLDPLLPVENPTLVSASPLQTVDVTPPPAPTLLTEIEATGSKIQFFWVVPSNIGDIVSFNVYRGNDTLTSEDPLFIVTGTLAIDTFFIEENETYCYQVSAVDASGNESDLSEVLCVNTNVADSSNPGTSGPVFEWNVPNIDSLSCNQEIPSTQVLQGLTVLAGGCFRAPETLALGPGATLRLSKGTVLIFGEAAKLIVPQNATFSADGTAEEPVVLTGAVSVPGYWGGIEFQNSASIDNLIRGTVIEYAGGGDSVAAIAVMQAGSRFRIEDTLVRNNQNQAIHFVFNNTVIDGFQRNRLTANEAIGQVGVELLQSMAGSSDFTGNTNDELDIPRNIFSNTLITIPDLGIPLRWNGILMTRGGLTIEPGVEFRMVSNALVDVEGAFTAIGTPDQPIEMKGGSNTTQPNWAGLRLSGRGSKTLSHVNLEDAGSAFPDTGAIEFDCTAGAEASLSIDNVDISRSASWGIYISDEDCNREIGKNVTYFNNTLGDVNIP